MDTNAAWDNDLGRPDAPVSGSASVEPERAPDGRSPQERPAATSLDSKRPPCRTVPHNAAWPSECPHCKAAPPTLQVPAPSERSAAYGHRETLCKRLRRWADARDKRLAAGGHAGVTGTELLREAAARIEELEAAISEYDGLLERSL